MPVAASSANFFKVRSDHAPPREETRASLKKPLRGEQHRAFQLPRVLRIPLETSPVCSRALLEGLGSGVAHRTKGDFIPATRRIARATLPFTDHGPVAAKHNTIRLRATAIKSERIFHHPSPF